MLISKTSLRPLLALLLLAGLAACGGGSGSSTTTPPVAETPPPGQELPPAPPVADTTPDAFSFTAPGGAVIGNTAVSEAIIVSGINTATPISIVGGEYNINDGSFTTEPGSVVAGQSVRIRITAPAFSELSAAKLSGQNSKVQKSTAEAAGTLLTATLTIGNISADFSVTMHLADTTPDTFDFSAQFDVTPGVFITSETINISGVNTATPIEITGGEYAIDDALFTDTAGVINNGQALRVRVLAASAGLTRTTATLNVGGVIKDFSVTTQVDITPDAFVFEAQTDVALSAVVESNSITVNGVDEAATITITGGEYSIDGAAFTAADGLIAVGQHVRLRVTAADTFGTSSTVTLVIGDTSADFTVTTIKDSQAPGAKILFPLPVSLTSSNTLLVRGEAYDAENSPISAVTVEGVAATSSDGFATWQALVPLALGKTLLNVSTEDVDGNIDPDADRVAVTTGIVMEDFQRARGIEFDADNNRALVIDETAKLLVAVDLDTRGRIILSGATTGTGPAFSKPTSVAVDRSRNRALVTDIGRKEIMAVDLATGNRSTLAVSSSCSLGGVKDKVPLAVAVDVANNRALAVDCFSSGWGVAAVDLTTGERSQLDTGGKRIDNLTSIAVDSQNNRVLLGDFGQVVISGGEEQNSPRIIAVDFTTGIRTVLSGRDSNRFVGSGDNIFANPVSVSMDYANNRVIVLDEDIDDLGAVFGVDLTTGERKVLSGPRSGGGSVGTRASIKDASAVSLNSLNGNALVLRTSSDVITNVNLNNGNRTNIANQTNSTLFESPQGLALDSNRYRVFTLDDIRDAMFSVNLTTAQTSFVSSNAFVSGSIDFDVPLGLAFDQNSNRVLVADGIKGLLSVDLDAGDSTANRSVLSGQGVGSGPTLTTPASVAIDSNSNLAYVGTSQTNAKLFAVDMQTGNRTLVADSSKGTGPTLRSVGVIVVDKVNERLLAINGGTDTFLFSVELATGNRTIISGSGIGNGIVFESPSSMILDAANNRLLVADRLANAIIAVDLTTGDRTEFSGATSGSGPLLNQPSGIVMSENNIALIMDAGADQLFALDLITGERVIVAR